MNIRSLFSRAPAPVARPQIIEYIASTSATQIVPNSCARIGHLEPMIYQHVDADRTYYSMHMRGIFGHERSTLLMDPATAFDIKNDIMQGRLDISKPVTVRGEFSSNAEEGREMRIFAARNAD